jgi:hypothetical protein
MGRRPTQEQEAAGADSFLDVITNIVGILIILVMVVGERAKSAPVPVTPSGPSRELVQAREEAVALERDVHELQARMLGVQQEMQLRAMERSQLQTLITAIEKELENRQQALGEKKGAEYAIDRDLAIAKDALAKANAEREMVDKAMAPQTVKITSYPTPLGKTVDDNEAHLQLKGGRLAVLPMDMLVARLRSILRSSVNRMGNNNELVDTIGPIEGFRMRYVISRRDMAQGSMFELAYVEFLPISGQLGEPVDDALREGSAFRSALARMAPDRYTITIWTYPDSFPEYARLKKELYEMGYAVAARPLPHGMAIGASPHGSKSAAQ